MYWATSFSECSSSNPREPTSMASARTTRKFPLSWMMCDIVDRKQPFLPPRKLTLLHLLRHVAHLDDVANRHCAQAQGP